LGFSRGSQRLIKPRAKHSGYYLIQTGEYFQQTVLRMQLGFRRPRPDGDKLPARPKPAYGLNLAVCDAVHLVQSYIKYSIGNVRTKTPTKTHAKVGESKKKSALRLIASQSR
jgi:hypothetical protein